MSDNLKWMNRHAVLLREPQWANIAAKENYKIRPDLRPLFDSHPDSLELLDAMAERKLYREGCEFIARMTHRRAAVWWGYCCLLDLFEERKAVESGAVKPEPDELELLFAEELKKLGLEPPSLKPPASIDEMCPVPKIDFDRILATPKTPPQDRSALAGASAAMRARIDRLNALIPAKISSAYASSFAKADAAVAAAKGTGVRSLYEAARSRAEAGPLTYAIDRVNTPLVRKLKRLQALLAARRQETIDQIKAAFPERYPTTPGAKLLLGADSKKRSDNAVQAVWRWIVSPDERNTSLALEAANAVPGTPESMLAMTAAWSFGDLAPEGKVTVPVPPELPGTGLNSVLLMLALDQNGHRKMPERYEHYFSMGMDTVFGKNLWPDAVSEKLSPHAQLAEKWAKGGVK